MKLIKIVDYQIQVADEALLVRPIRRLFNMDRSQNKEQFYKQMSLLFYVYSPSSNYSYIIDENDRMREVMQQEGLQDIKNNAEFKAAAEAYKKLCITSSSALLEDLKRLIDNMRKALNRLTFDGDDEKEVINNIKNAASITAMLPKIIKDVQETEKAVAKELEEQASARGSQELTVGDIWDSQGI